MARDPDKYRAYMKEYMKKKYHDEQKSKGKNSMPRATKQPTVENNFDPLQGQESMPPELLKLGKDFINGQAEKGDKSMSTISKVLEYAPTVIGLIQQFAKGMADSQANHQQQQQLAQAPVRTIQPPPFYGTSKAVAYLDDPVWCAQRDAWMASRAQSPQIYAPAQMAQNYQYEQRMVQAQGLPAQPRSMEELRREATNDPFMKPVRAEPQGMSSDERTVETSGEGALNKAEKARREASGETPLGDDVMKAVVEEMREDNKRAVKLVVDWINGQREEELLKRLDKEDPFEEVGRFLPFLPVQYRDLITTLSSEQVVEILRGGCLDKMESVEKAGKTQKFMSAWETLQKRLM